MSDADFSSVAQALPSIRPDSAIVHAMRSIRHRIDEARSVRSLDPIFGYLYSAIERQTSEDLRAQAACGPRCAWCCHTRVSATAPEILFLARTLPAGTAAAIPARAAQRRRGWGQPLQKSLAPCAVLADGLCTAHPQRPIACRTTMSLDAEQCRRACEIPEELVIPSAIASVALRAVYDIALQGALLNAGYSPDRLDLATGLEDAIANPDAETNWLAGDLVFPSALRIEQQAYLEDPIRLALYRVAFS